MAILATENNRWSNTVKQELWPESAYCREVITINDAAATLKIGAVLGKVTVGGKYKLVEATAADGSEVAAAVLLEDVTVAASTDKKVLALVRGPAAVSFNALSYGASVDTANEKLALRGQLEAKGIQVLDAV